MLNEPVIVDAVRTPMGRGKPGGALSNVHPVDLLARVLKELVRRNSLDPGKVDDVIVGCVSQVAEQSATPGRMALLAAGFPVHVPSTTIDRKDSNPGPWCCSSAISRRTTDRLNVFQSCF